jgi:serine/threonine-protein kinase
MDPDWWQRVQQVFLAAAELPASARAAFVAETCGADEDLRAEVESLLVAAGGEDVLLDAGRDDLLLLLADEPAEAEPVPDRAGPWAIEEIIGRGGMGTVHRARRDDGEYRREVALKIVRPSGQAAEAFRRFHRERRILAALEHPGIARLYDSGVLEDGRPWLAMELVRGEPIHAHCDRRRLGLRARLALFEQVAAAVDYAHRKLIIHRDLKPSNIMVTAEAEVKLLDFGIARLLDPDPDDVGGVDGAEVDPPTRPQQRLLTPEYASPEQLQGAPLTIASDVYSLGILLHVLLVGCRPSGTAVPHLAGLDDAVARDRGTTVERLRRELRGELATIVRKALHPEPDGRYPSAAALAEDLVRWRSGRPILARPPSAGYRARKFIGRNRVAVAVGTAAVLGLTGGLALAMYQAGVARQERDAAESVSAFLENLFTASDPFEGTGARLDTLRIGAYMERAADRIEADLAAQPVLRARMQGILGTVHGSIGAYDRARTLLEASMAGYRALSGEDSPELAQTLGRLGRVQRSAGDPAGAEAAFRQALAIYARRADAPAEEVSRLQAGLAGELLSQNRLDEAAELLGVLTDGLGEESPDAPTEVIDQLNLLAALLFRQGRLDESIINMERALALSRARLGAGHPGTATLTHNLGMALHRRGRYQESETVLREAWSALEQGLGPDHPSIGVTMKALANVLEATGRWEEADSLYREAVAFTRRTAGPGNTRDLGIALHDHGGALVRQGQVERAAPLLEESLSLERQMAGAGSPGVGIIQMTIGDLRQRQGDAAAAERTYREALAILGKAFPPSHPRLLAARSGLGLSLADQGRTAEGEAMLLGAYQDATTLADGGVAARDAARALVRYYEPRGNASEASRWRDLATPPPGG